jgi:hypothetical protein
LIPCLGAGEVVRGHLLNLTECGKGTGKEIAAEGKAEFERGSNKIGLAHKLGTASSTTHTGAASDSEGATGVSTTDPSDTRRDSDPGRRTEKEIVPTAVDNGRSARPERHDETRSTPQTSSPGPLPAEGAQRDTEEGQKITGSTPSSQENGVNDTANKPSPTFTGGQREEANTANVPESDRTS